MRCFLFFPYNQNTILKQVETMHCLLFIVIVSPLWFPLIGHVGLECSVVYISALLLGSSSTRMCCLLFY